MLHIRDMYFHRVFPVRYCQQKIKVIGVLIIQGKIGDVDIKVQLLQLVENQLNNLSQFLAVLHCHGSGADLLQCGFDLQVAVGRFNRLPVLLQRNRERLVLTFEAPELNSLDIELFFGRTELGNNRQSVRARYLEEGLDPPPQA